MNETSEELASFIMKPDGVFSILLLSFLLITPLIKSSKVAVWPYDLDAAMKGFASFVELAHDVCLFKPITFEMR